MKIINKEHLRFVYYNLIFVVLTISIILYLSNGAGNSYPFNLVGISTIIATPIIVLQYPLLILKRNWVYKTFIFYLSMLVYLFILGMILSWNERVGGNLAGSWTARFDAGIRLMVFGQLFGGLFGFALIWFYNYLMAEKLIMNENKKTKLKKIATDESGWKTLFFNQESKTYWEKTYPNSEFHGGGKAELKEVKLSEEIKKIYKIE
jgi:hypothetical protein